MTNLIAAEATSPRVVWLKALSVAVAAVNLLLLARLVRALQTINKGRSLSMPKLLVTNNQQATIDSTLDLSAE